MEGCQRGATTVIGGGGEEGKKGGRDERMDGGLPGGQAILQHLTTKKEFPFKG
jgi:hypothetical protein